MSIPMIIPWKKIPKRLLMQAIMYHSIGGVPKGADRKRYNKECLRSVGEFAVWLKKNQKKLEKRL